MEKSASISARKVVAVKRTKVNTLVPYKSSSDEDTNEQETRKGPAVMKNGVQKVVSSEERTSSKSFLMWENNANVCWLDASMALIVHNQTLIKSLSEDSSSQIAKIVKFYYEAVSILNNCSDERHIEVRVKLAKDLLKNVQESVLKYLQPILKYKEGEPDSAFCALYNLISEDKSMKGYFEVEFTWFQSCKECASHRASKHKKPIVTLPKVILFQAHCPVAIYQCPKCKEPNQKMMLNFKTLPQCLLFHFESGAGVGELKFNDFEVDGRTYRLTGVMTLEKGKESLVNHFITFVRDAESDTWLECNDLNDEIMCFCMVPPILELEDVCILMYEANDNRGTITNRSLSADKRGLGEESVSGSADIPLIDLADDAEKETSDNGRRCNQPREVAKKYRNAAGLLEAIEDDLNNEPSSLEPLLQNDSGDFVSGEKSELGVFHVEMAALSLQERAITTLSSPTITNGTGVLSEINTGEIFVPLDILNKDPALPPVNRHSSYANQAHFQSESVTFAENTGKPVSEIFINENCQDSTAKQRISKMNNVTGNLSPNIKEWKEANENQNASPTLTEVNDSSKPAAPESGKSNGQIINQAYKQLLHTLNASLKNSPHDNPEEGKENVAGNVPVSKQHAESVNEGQASEIKETQFLPIHSSEHNDLEMPSFDCDLDPSGPKTTEQNLYDKSTKTKKLQKNIHPENVAHNCDSDSYGLETKQGIKSGEKTTTTQLLRTNVKITHLENDSHNCDPSETKEKALNNDIAESTKKPYLQNAVEKTDSVPTNEAGELLMGNTCENQRDEQKPINLKSQIVSSDFEELASSVSENGTSTLDEETHKIKPRPRLQSKDCSKVQEEEPKYNGVSEAGNTASHLDAKNRKKKFRPRLQSKDCSEVHNETETTCHFEVSAERQLRARVQSKDCSKVQEEEPKYNGVSEAGNIASHLGAKNRKKKFRPRLQSKDYSEVHNETETTCHLEASAERQLRARLQSKDFSKVHEEEPNLDASKNSKSYSDSITCKRKLRTRAQSKDFSEVHDKDGLKCTSYKRQTKMVHEKTNSDVLKKSISSDGETIEEKSTGPNTRRGRCKNDTVTTSKTEEKNTNVEKVLPRRRSRRSSSGVCESANEIQSSVSPDASNVPADKRVTRKRSRSMSSDKVASADTDKLMPLYKNESSNKSSTVESVKPHSVDPCNIVERKVKRKRSHSKSPEVLHNLEEKSFCLKLKRYRAKSSELFDVIEHSDNGDSKSSEVLDISKGKSVSPKPERGHAKSSDDEMEHSENGDLEFLKTLQNLTEKSVLKPRRHRAKPSELLDDGMKHSENAKAPKKLSRKRNLDSIGPKSANEGNIKDNLDVPGYQESGVDQNTFLEACGDSMEQSKNTKMLQGKSSLEADGPYKQNMNSNLNGLMDHKSDCNQSVHINFSNASVKLKENSSEELLPSDCDNEAENLKNNVNMKTCSCDCTPQDMDELIDIEVDSVLISIFRGFDIRKHT